VTGEVVSPMAGTIAFRHVEDGGHVEAGDVVVELEAMKMLTQLTAPCAGRVHHRYELGEVVGQDDVVATVEPE
jgi:biotin carboxyl carrier protein